MARYPGDYSEGFLGLGYSHPSVAASEYCSGSAAGDDAVRTDAERTAMVSSLDNGNGCISYQLADDNRYDDAQEVVFVAANRRGGNGPQQQEMADPQQQQQQQCQLEKEAEIARSKAQDILRNILSGDGANSGGAQTSFETNQINNNPCTSSTRGNANNYDLHGHHGPPEGYFGTAQCDTGTNEYGATQQQSDGFETPSAASIETDARAFRLKAMDIIRKFQSQENNGSTSDNGNAIGSEVQDTANASGDSIAPPRSAGTGIFDTNDPASQYDAPQDTLGTGSSGNGAHVIPGHQPRPDAPHSQSAASIPTAEAADVSVKLPPAATPPWELGRRRRECLAKDEDRKQRALFKNLQHVARLEEERLLKQLNEVQQVKTLEAQLEERYTRKMEARTRHHQEQQEHNNRKRERIDNGSNDINTSGAGIGTKQRRKAEAKRQRTALPPSLRNNHKNGKKGDRGPRGDNNKNGGGGGASVAIYVSNLPTDGSVGEDTIQALFASYGSLRKVHFYIDKATGQKKGDALVIYSLNEGDGQPDETGLTESVCSQVNGCELPGGAVLRVEPSDPYHGVRTKTSHYGHSALPSETDPQPQEQSSAGKKTETGLIGEKIVDRGQPLLPSAEIKPEQSGGEPEEEDDLDGFFASLE